MGHNVPRQPSLDPRDERLTSSGCQQLRVTQPRWWTAYVDRDQRHPNSHWTAQRAAADLVARRHDRIAGPKQLLLDTQVRNLRRRNLRSSTHAPTSYGSAGGPSRRTRASSVGSVEGYTVSPVVSSSASGHQR